MTDDHCPHGVPVTEECTRCHKDDSLLEDWTG